ncbi:mate-domain-containing protein [Gaertneriomyces semiglobifer]|nr:mate-domain-containing protein [Gaertneriomyces semiglobifer]
MAPPNTTFFDDGDLPDERTSLLPQVPIIEDANPHIIPPSEKDPTLPLVDATHITSNLVKHEAAGLLKLAWPVCLAYILQTTLNLSAIFAVGHLGTKELAATALTTMMCNVTGYSVGIGMASALDTLCSQAHTGSRDIHALGKHLQRGVVVMGILSVPIGVLWWNAEVFLLLVGQDREVARLSGLVNECMKRFLQAQGIMTAALYVMLIAAPCNILLQYIFVYVFGLGAPGAFMATSSTYMLLPALTAFYIRFINGGDAWGGWDLQESFHWPKIWEFIKLGGGCVAMTCSEWWAFEVMALAAGWLGEVELAAQTIVLNTCSMTYVLPLGVSIGGSTRIGNSLGAGKEVTAKAAAYACMGMGVLVALGNCTLLLAVKDVWGYAWTTSPEVVALVSKVIPLGAIFQISDGIGACAGGILRGCGRPELGAYINLAGYYILGIPLGLYLTFGPLKMDLLGLWVGLTVALLGVSVMLLAVVGRMDWRKEVMRARTRVNEESATTASRLEDGEDPVTYGTTTSGRIGDSGSVV